MSRARMQRRPSWRVFDGWGSVVPGEAELQLSWAGTAKWLASVGQLAQAEAAALRPLLRPWDVALEDIGGDPSGERWDAFRPLRLSREEDWSDWLGWLLQTQPGAGVARRLFGASKKAGVLQELRREVPVAGGDQRADLVLLWRHRAASQVEVKLWDTSFGKSTATAKACEAAFRLRRPWCHYVLLPDEMEEDWRKSAGTEGIDVVTWTTLVVELRRALLEPRLQGQWRVFARAYCGAIEQRILGVPSWERFEKMRVHASVFHFGRILEEASHGTRR